MRLICFAVLVLFIASCSNKSNHPDVSHIKVDLTIDRFEKDFFSIDTNNILAGLNGLNKKYPRFYPVFANDILLMNQDHIIQNGEVGLTPAGTDVIRNFTRWYTPVYNTIQEKYKNTAWLEKELEEAFRFVKYYYQDYPVPGVLSFIGTFDAPGMVLTPKYLAIGLHQFAGRNFPAYSDPVIQQMYPEYVSRRFDEEYITAGCMKAVVDDIYRAPETGKLIELMIEKGKQWYLLNKFIPEAPDSVKTGYTKRQTEWVNANEGNIWGSILQNTPDLYTMDNERIQNYIGEAPFTQNMEASNASPGNIGQWVGWRIVEKFAENNKELTAQQVMATSPNKIFQEAKYRPK
ncbi:MAG: gliding motility lipoprotein GldB [Flavisolibacter sp.]